MAYSPEDKARIKARIVAGLYRGEYVADMCAEEGMPDTATIDNWAQADEEFSAQRTRARAGSGELHERAVGGILSDLRDGAIPVDVAKVLIHGETWLAKVRAPKVYGDKLEQSVTGSLGMRVERELTDAELAAIARQAAGG